jgi:dethiobiotin synthetase
MAAPRGFFITGTDTGVGKTRTACALLRALIATGIRATAMKPVAAGAVTDAQGLLNEDVAALIAAGALTAPRALINPYCFAPAIAPHIAAAKTGVAIDLEVIARAFESLAVGAECVVVEGAGGFCVPLGDAIDGGDLAQRLGLPVILVVGLRLGCLNHALLTAQAIRARGLALAGWIANHIDPAMPVLQENVAALIERLDAPLLAEFTYTPETMAAQINCQFNLTQLGIARVR